MALSPQEGWISSQEGSLLSAVAALQGCSWRENGGGGLVIQLTSIHFTALSRHVTEAVQIAQGMDWVKLRLTTNK